MTRWIERWHGSGPDRGWWVWETDHGNPVAYIGEGDHSERLTSILVEKHNAAVQAHGRACALAALDAAAKVCDAEAKHNAEMARLDRDSRYDHMEQGALDCAGEIRALMEDKQAGHSTPARRVDVAGGTDRATGDVSEGAA